MDAKERPKNPITFYEVSYSDLLTDESRRELIMLAPRGNKFTFGATPLDYIGTINQQFEVRTQLQKLTYSIPHGMPMEIASYVSDTFVGRFSARGVANEENYLTALRYGQAEAFDDQTLDMLQRAEVGNASPAELLYLREVVGIRSIELGAITHPYGEHIEYLEDMHASVKYAVEELFDGEYYDEDKQKEHTRYSVKEPVIGQDGVIYGFLMTRKRDVAELPDGTKIRDRSSFVLRIDEASGFDQELADKMRAIAMDEAADWKELLLSIESSYYSDGRFTDIVRQIADDLLINDEFEKAIPISSTVYAYNEDTAMVVEMTQAAKNAELRDENNAIIRDTFEHTYNVANGITDEDRIMGTGLLWDEEFEKKVLEIRHEEDMYYINGAGSDERMIPRKREKKDDSPQ